MLIDAPGLEDQKNSMLIGHRAGGKSRNIFVYSETGKVRQFTASSDLITAEGIVRDVVVCAL